MIQAVYGLPAKCGGHMGFICAPYPGNYRLFSSNQLLLGEFQAYFSLECWYVNYFIFFSLIYSIPFTSGNPQATQTSTSPYTPLPHSSPSLCTYPILPSPL